MKNRSQYNHIAPIEQFAIGQPPVRRTALAYYVWAYVARGAAYSGLSQYQNATNEYTKAIQLDPNEAMAYYSRGISYGELGQDQTAINDYTEAMQLLTCHRCGSPYYGESHPCGEYIDMRMSQERRGPGRSCKPKPRSRSVEALVDQMGDRVMPYLQLDATWKSRITAVLRSDEPPQEDRGQGERLRRALENLRKQHQWGDISDDEYRREREIIVRQLKVHTATVEPTHLPNLDRSANFLEDLPALWLHPGVTHEEREALIQQVFWRIAIDGKEFVDIEPKPAYAPLFATMLTAQKVGYREVE